MESSRPRPRLRQQSLGSGRSTLGLWVLLPILAVLLAYVWYVSAGKWTSWPPSAIYNYYGRLAAAFQHGQLYLDDKPATELLSLPDPYRIGARKGISYIWDSSLFHGRYYLYWGPVPAIMLWPLRIVFPSEEIGDIYLAFAFVCGVYAMLCVLALTIWNRFFPALPTWTLALGLIIVGLAPPLTWMLNRPEVYEAAIAAGQVFLFGSVYLLHRGFDSDDHASWKFALASLFWGLAIGSRTNQALPVSFLAAATLLRLADKRDSFQRDRWRGRALAATLVPVIVCALALGWYNWARFGSVLEFGYRYQLTLLQLPKHYDEIFSVAYVGPNAYNYFANPFTFAPSFPFIKPQYGLIDFGGLYAFPKIYFSEAVTGLVYTFPFMAMALIALAPSGLIRRGARSWATEVPSESRPLFWLRVNLFGVFAVQILSLLLFFFATERYLAEAVPSLALLALIGFWRGYALLADKPHWRNLLCATAIVTALVTVVTSALLAISSYQERFATANPALLSQINRLFTH